MTFMESVQTCVKQKYAAFSGRASRSEYWWFFLFTVLGGIVLNLIDSVLGTTIGYNRIIGGMIIHREVGIISALFNLAMLVPAIAVSVRRLHDTDRSGWFFLLILTPIAGALFGSIGLLVSFAGWIVLLVFFVQQGTNGRNRFGDDPLRPVSRGSGF